MAALINELSQTVGLALHTVVRPFVSELVKVSVNLFRIIYMLHVILTIIIILKSTKINILIYLLLNILYICLKNSIFNHKTIKISNWKIRRRKDRKQSFITSNHSFPPSPFLFLKKFNKTFLYDEVLIEVNILLYSIIGVTENHQGARLVLWTWRGLFVLPSNVEANSSVPCMSYIFNHENAWYIFYTDCNHCDTLCLSFMMLDGLCLHTDAMVP